MTAVLQHSPSSHHLPSSSSPSLSSSPNDGTTTLLSRGASSVGGGYRGVERERRGGSEEDQLPLLNLLLAAVRKSLSGCRREGGEEDLRSMEIGWPTDVRHVAHVTFDRFHGFLGLPVEFEPEVPRRAPSASAKVFGVSTDSMQCSFDTRGNSVPTILLLMQRCLYEQGGIQAEGIFRINAGNNQEEYVRDQLNTGIVPEGVDVHCLAGLIKAWFRELPTGVLDPLNPEQVMQCQSEEECVQLVKLLPPTEAALLDWAINLMADVVLEEQQNKMNARNVAMVFAPNMTQMADPLTALMYAVQVMNFLKTLILKTLKDRQDSALRNVSVHHSDPSDENGHQSLQFQAQVCSEEATDQDFVPEEPVRIGPNHASEENSTSDDTIDTGTCKSACLEDTPEQSSGENLSEIPADIDSLTHGPGDAANDPSAVHVQSRKNRRSGSMNHRKGKKASGHSAVRAASPSEKSRGVSIVSRINSKAERVEAWR